MNIRDSKKICKFTLYKNLIFRNLNSYRFSPYPQYIFKLDGVGPVDNRSSTGEAPPIGEINPFSKIAVTLESVMQFRCP